jgi:hypothetical protein
MNLVGDQSEICVFILSADGIIRNDLLVESLEKSGFRIRVIIGYQVDQSFQKDFSRPSVISHKNRIGKLLTLSEIAALLTHRKAQENALGHGRVVFLEDDAIVNQNFTRQNIEQLFLELESFSSPSIITLYAEEWSLFWKQKSLHQFQFPLLKAVFPPAGAVGYLMSTSAISKVLSCPLDFGLPADWPQWSMDIDFYIPQDSFLNINKESNLSRIGERDKQSFSFRGMLVSLIEGNGFLLVFRYHLWYPLLWKCAKKLGKPFRLCGEDELHSISRIFLI